MSLPPVPIAVAVGRDFSQPQLESIIFGLDIILPLLITTPPNSFNKYLGRALVDLIDAVFQVLAAAKQVANVVSQRLLPRVHEAL